MENDRQPRVIRAGLVESSESCPVVPVYLPPRVRWLKVEFFEGRGK